jgi:hypothetical protein
MDCIRAEDLTGISSTVRENIGQHKGKFGEVIYQSILLQVQELRSTMRTS